MTETVIDVIKMTLAHKEVNILEAATGKEAIEVATNNSIDVILIDIGLPDISGIDLLKKLQELDKMKNIPMIAVTAYMLKDEKDRFLTSGFSGIIYKPIDVANFAKQISSFFNKASQPSSTKPY